MVQAADFQRLLGTPPRSRSTHFALHHLAQGPFRRLRTQGQLASKGGIQALTTDLSTADDGAGQSPVDESPGGLWLGYVVPKRHAKRAVTRSLIKRQIRQTFERHLGLLPPGLWLVRLRLPFTPTAFASARSDALAVAARQELEALLTLWHGQPSRPASPRAAVRPGGQGISHHDPLSA